MIRVTLSAKGVFAFARKPKNEREKIYMGMVKKAQHEILSEYASGRTWGAKLGDRLKPSAWAIYGLKPRSAGYQRQQIRALGVITPYASPRVMHLGELTRNIIEGRVQRVIRELKKLSDHNHPHMADILTKPTVGFTVKQFSVRTNVRSTLRLPGARILNRNPQNQVYSNQLLNLNLGGGRDRIALLRRLNQRLADYQHILFRASIAKPFTSGAA